MTWLLRLDWICRTYSWKKSWFFSLFKWTLSIWNQFKDNKFRMLWCYFYRTTFQDWNYTLKSNLSKHVKKWWSTNGVCTVQTEVSHILPLIHPHSLNLFPVQCQGITEFQHCQLSLLRAASPPGLSVSSFSA